MIQPSSTSNVLSWTAATDNIGVSAYDVYRNGTCLATLDSRLTGYTDATAVSGTSYTYRIAARDLAGNTTSASVSTTGTTDTSTSRSYDIALGDVAAAQTAP